MTTQTQTAFGRVLTELLEERGLEATPETVSQPVLDRMADEDADYPGSLLPIGVALDLDREEIIRLSLALAFEQE